MRSPVGTSIMDLETGPGAKKVMRLKADLHVHSGEDPHDIINYSAESIIDAAAKLNLEVLAITCHGIVLDSGRLRDYAWRRGILLVPGAEVLIEGKHVVVLNPDEDQLAARTFLRLRELGRREAYFIAPHAFYPDRSCLGRKLEENIDLFDAVEFCGFYFRGINPNRKAVDVAKRHGLPLIGTSDTHSMPYGDSTVSWIDVEEKSLQGVLAALRTGRIHLDTKPCPTAQALKIMTGLVREALGTLSRQT